MMISKGAVAKFLCIQSHITARFGCVLGFAIYWKNESVIRETNVKIKIGGFIMLKRVISILLVSLSLTATAFAVDLYVDTQKIETDTPPTTVEGRTLVPVRAIFEALGATVEWDSDTWTATGKRDDTTVVIQINNTTAYVNGEAKTLDVPAQLINDRTMIPARFVSEALGCEVTWYEDAQTAAVADQLKGQAIYVTKTGKRYHFSETCNGGTYYQATLAEAMGRHLTPCDKCVLTIERR
jgi:hypothetical protein